MKNVKDHPISKMITIPEWVNSNNISMIIVSVIIVIYLYLWYKRRARVLWASIKIGRDRGWGSRPISAPAQPVIDYPEITDAFCQAWFSRNTYSSRAKREGFKMDHPGLAVDDGGVTTLERRPQLGDTTPKKYTPEEISKSFYADSLRLNLMTQCAGAKWGGYFIGIDHSFIKDILSPANEAAGWGEESFMQGFYIFIFYMIVFLCILLEFVLIYFLLWFTHLVVADVKDPVQALGTTASIGAALGVCGQLGEMLTAATAETGAG